MLCGLWKAEAAPFLFQIQIPKHTPTFSNPDWVHGARVLFDILFIHVFVVVRSEGPVKVRVMARARVRARVRARARASFVVACSEGPDAIRLFKERLSV